MLQRTCIGVLLSSTGAAAFTGWVQSTPRVLSPQLTATRHTLTTRWSTTMTSIFEPPTASDELLEASLTATMAIEVSTACHPIHLSEHLGEHDFVLC